MAEPNQYRPERNEPDQSEGLGAGAGRPGAVGVAAGGSGAVGLGAHSTETRSTGTQSEGEPGTGHRGTRDQRTGDQRTGDQRTRDQGIAAQSVATHVTRTQNTLEQGAADQGRGVPQPRNSERPRTRTRSTEGRREETRQRILTAAGQLFREHGIDGIGVDAVMKQAGLTHGGFYLHFPSKESLAAEVSQSLLEKAAVKWDEISRSADHKAALERIVRHYLDPARVASGHCCPLTTIGPDVARRSASRSAIGGALSGMLDALARVLPGRRRQAALASLSTMVGAVVLSRLADDPALADAFLQAAADSILPAKRASSRRVSNRMELFTEQRAPD
jgi:TetR/AcrR family transcriptional repressor of nem operon